MYRLEVIQKIVNKIDCKTYLEIGVRYGSVFLKINAPKKIAVDPKFQIPFYKKLFFIKDFFKNKYFQKTSDSFFLKNSKNEEIGRFIRKQSKKFLKEDTLWTRKVLWLMLLRKKKPCERK